ncbi:MAG: hypothetical protein ABIB47_05450 [Candidatus Woesearchaeota archaeon]
MKCIKCTYIWEGRVTEPKACPRCKSRLDFISIKNINRKNREVR